MTSAPAVGHPVGVQDLPALGRLLEQLRERKGISQAEAARRSGIAPAYLSMVEGAKPNTKTRAASVPAQTVLRALAEELDGDRAELLELAGYDEAAAYARQSKAEADERPDEVDQVEYERLAGVVKQMVRDELRAAGLTPPEETADQEAEERR